MNYPVPKSGGFSEKLLLDIQDRIAKGAERKRIDDERQNMRQINAAIVSRLVEFKSQNYIAHPFIIEPSEEVLGGVRVRFNIDSTLDESKASALMKSIAGILPAPPELQED